MRHQLTRKGPPKKKKKKQYNGCSITISLLYPSALYLSFLDYSVPFRAWINIDALSIERKACRFCGKKRAHIQLLLLNYLRSFVLPFHSAHPIPRMRSRLIAHQFPRKTGTQKTKKKNTRNRRYTELGRQPSLSQPIFFSPPSSRRHDHQF
ncbi:hypothetical protein B0H16DRAFT_1541934 [Mycena metata]|uniref:Uncharacterized protein n=1 Tax=Mycena metata TaxID=1033252 RepID=A0AAD7J138_9AGAR|nr:hypothetical protein B0H16DRAFT_1541934 [Mycena metata]